ncbi:MAG: hypothetical protein C4581_10030 [Nitrospiraceae bacterium]|nr:MAG: hypothetical protein C4581_10030 [Nitrospiraceae bacterium]
MKRFMLTISIVALCIFAMSSWAEAQFNYSGGISIAGGSALGTGNWNDNPMGKTNMSWDVSWDGTGLVHYSYTFEVAHHDISHLSLELSDSFSATDITNVTINGNASSDYSIGNFTGGTAPYNTMPGDMYGVKFDMPSNTLLATIAFDSTRMPTWGDIYARCGVRVEHTLPKTDPAWKQWNSAWNAGFSNGETSGTGNDPILAAGNGPYLNHVLVPDSVAVVPEPVSSALFVIGATMFAGRKYIKRRRLN